MLLGPLARVVNRNIGETTPARDLCRKLDGKVVAVRVRDTGLAMFFRIGDQGLELGSESETEPDVILSGSLITLAQMAGPQADDGDGSAVRGGALDISGDAFTAQAFQKLLRYARPDPEEELSRFVGDVAAHRAGEFARELRSWALRAGQTMGANVREYLQEERRELPSRYEVERFSKAVDTLRDDVARLEARMLRLPGAS